MAEKKFETAFKKLEKIVEKLESEDLELEEALKLYEEGIGLARFCGRKLEAAEKKVQKLKRDETGKLVTEDLDLFSGGKTPANGEDE